MLPVTLFTTVYMLIGLCLSVVFLAKYRDVVESYLDMEDASPGERKAIMFVGCTMFIFGWPVLLSQIKSDE